MHVPDQPAAEMIAAGLRAGQLEAMRAAYRPALHHHAGQLTMELDAPGILAITKSLVGVGLGRRQQRRVLRQRKALAVELVDHLRPVQQLLAGFRRLQRIPADLDQSFIMALDPAAKMVGKHLRAEADAEKGPVFLERDFEPAGLTPDELI